MSSTPTPSCPQHPAVGGRPKSKWAAGAVLAAAALAGLTACSSADTPADQAGAVTVAEPWAKAAEDGMTSVFADLINESGDEVTIVAASSPVAETTELHEVVLTAGVAGMQEKDGGFVLGADSSYLLEPGGDHLMLMELTESLEPGDDVPMTLTFDDGSTLRFSAPIRDFAGAQEDYGDLADHEESMHDEH